MPESSLKQPARPPTAGSFQKGKSGNPGGRAKKTEEERTLEAMCREKTPQAFNTIFDIMVNGESDKTRLSAAQYLLDRGHGKPVSVTEISGRDGKPIEFQNIQLQVVGVRAS